jgi:hypothetical protein
MPKQPLIGPDTQEGWGIIGGGEYFLQQAAHCPKGALLPANQQQRGHHNAHPLAIAQLGIEKCQGTKKSPEGRNPIAMGTGEGIVIGKCPEQIPVKDKCKLNYKKGDLPKRETSQFGRPLRAHFPFHFSSQFSHNSEDLWGR